MIRLTETVKCGGCASKASASELSRVLKQLPKSVSEHVLVGLETPDDAGVYLIDPEKAIIQTLDFFMPIVDDPYDFGRIAATNSLSDVYAMGGTPLTAMNIVCFPMNELPSEVLVEMLRGGAAQVEAAGAVLLGGHTVNDDTIKFGLSVTGIAHPRDIKAIVGAQVGDNLVLTKALGTAMVTTALKRNTVRPEDLDAAVASMTTLNAAAARAMVRVGVHSCTDVTGFSLMGHLFEMMEASGVGAVLDHTAIPYLPGALDYAAQGIDTGGGRNNVIYVGAKAEFSPEVPEHVRAVLFDPQTSGGLLMAVAPEQTEALIAELENEGVAIRAIVGRVVEASPGTVRVR